MGPRGPVPGPRSRSGASPSGRCHTCAIEAFVVSENTLRGLRKFQAGFQALSLSLPSLPFSRPLPPPRLSPSLFLSGCLSETCLQTSRWGSEPGVACLGPRGLLSARTSSHVRLRASPSPVLRTPGHGEKPRRRLGRGLCAGLAQVDAQCPLVSSLVATGGGTHWASPGGLAGHSGGPGPSHSILTLDS